MNIANLCGRPDTRRLARELGVDIYESGERARRAHQRRRCESSRKARSPRYLPQRKAPPEPGTLLHRNCRISQVGKIERVSMRGVRRKNSRASRRILEYDSARHPTRPCRHYRTEQLRARFAPKAEQAGGKMTVTAIALKVCAAALKVFPQFNATIDMEKEEIIYKQYISIGWQAIRPRFCWFQ